MDLFTNSKRVCSVHNLAEFYANYIVTNGVVISIVNDHMLRFDARDLGDMLEVPSDGFDVYVHEDKSVLGDDQLL